MDCTMMRILFALICIKALQASEVHFEAFPKELKANLSDSASMRCSLSNTDSFVRISSTAIDVRHISSIFITKNDGVEVASVTSFDPPMALTDIGNLEVKGSLPATSGEGFIQLTWKDPSKMYLGDYKCEVNAIEARGHAVILTSDLKLIAAEPSINDVIAEFNSKLLKLQQETDQKQQETDQKQQETDQKQQETDRKQQNMTKEIDRLSKESHQQQNTIDSQKDLLNNQSHEIDRLTQENDQQQHILSNQSSEISRLNACTSKSVAFTALMSNARFTSHRLMVSSGQTVKWDSVTLNQGGAYNASTGEFTCVISGLYVFDVHVMGDNSQPVCVQLQKNGSRLVGLFKDDNINIDDASLSHVVQLQQGDVVRVALSCSSGLFQGSINSNVDKVNYFSGHLVHNAECSTP